MPTDEERGLRLGVEQEKRLRAWPKDRIRPKSVALGVMSLLAEVDALRAELAGMTADRDAIRRHLEILALETTRRLNEMADIQDRYESDLDAARRQTARIREAFIKHRTATHEVAPKFCKTCQESDAALAQPGDRREGAVG